MWWLPLIAYLLGSIPFAYLITKEKVGVDVRTVGSGNVGATNVLRVAGSWAAVLVLLLDMAKGLLPILFGRLLEAPAAVLGATALAAVLGHVCPLFLGFRGGKGVATAIGAFLPLATAAAVASVLVFALTLAWKRYVSLASVVSVATFPAWVYACGHLGWLTQPWSPVLWSSLAAAALVVGRHTSNIRRIAAGRESRLGERLEITSG